MNQESIDAIFALRPDLAPVGLYDTLCYGEAQAVAARPLPGGVGPVEPLENVFQFLAGQGLALVCHCQQTALFTLLPQCHASMAVFDAVFLCVVQ